MKGVKKRAQHQALAAGTSRGAPSPPAPPAPRPPQQPTPPPWHNPAPPAAPQQQQGGGNRRGGRRGGRKQPQQQATEEGQAHGGAPRPNQPTPPWTYGTNPWTGVVHAYSMPVPRAPAPSIFGQHPSSHQAYFAGPAAAPPGASYPAYGAAPPAYYAPPTAAGYTAAAPPSEGTLPRCRRRGTQLSSPRCTRRHHRATTVAAVTGTWTRAPPLT